VRKRSWYCFRYWYVSKNIFDQTTLHLFYHFCSLFKRLQLKNGYIIHTIQLTKVLKSTCIWQVLMSSPAWL